MTNSKTPERESEILGKTPQDELIIPSYLIPQEGWVVTEIFKRWSDVGESIKKHELLDPGGYKSLNFLAHNGLGRTSGAKYGTKSHKSESVPPKLDLGHNHSVSPIEFSPEVRAILTAWYMDFLASLKETSPDETSEIKGLPIAREPQSPDETQE